jgi:hypothetical protein
MPFALSTRALPVQLQFAVLVALTEALLLNALYA